MPRTAPTLLSLFACVLLLPACAGVGDFDVERTNAEQRVQGSPIAGLLGDLFAVPIPMDVDVASETAARDAGPAQAARLRALVLHTTNTEESAGDTDDFGFLDSVDVYIESTRQGSRLPRTLVAQASDIAASPRLEFHVVRSVDVLPYAEEGSRLISEVKGRLPPDDVSFAGRFTLRVELF